MNPSLDRIVILADESANWKIAGLRQLDRLVLALDEFAKSATPESKIDIFIFWRPDMAIEKRWRPSDPRLTRCKILEFSESALPGARVLNTRLLVKRSGLETFLHDSVSIDLDHSIVNESAVWEKVWQRFENACADVDPPKSKMWRYLDNDRDVTRAERWLLQGSGKTQDGFVSRFLNRPISRLITRALLRFPITPSAWTMLIFPFLVIAFLFLVRGDYGSFVIGCAIFQLYSILDGCDGEIARAKNLISESGGRLDTLCDTVGNLLLVIGVGLGVRIQHPSSGWIYAGEGIFCALLIAVNELWLHKVRTDEELPPNGISTALYPRHRTLAQRSGLLFLGERNVWWLVQLTKRDVAILFFLALSIAGFPQWILHLSLLVAAITLSLSASAMRASRGRRHTVGGSVA